MVSTRFAGVDGVSLEAAKVAAALRPDGYEFFWFGGELGPEFQPGFEYPPAHFGTVENRELEQSCFGGGPVGPETLAAIDDRAADLERTLERFASDNSVDVLLVQNALAIPMQIPLGIAITRLLRRSGIPTVAHHHDFSWERERFSDCGVPEILEEFFPPISPNLAHVVINRDARDELRARRGVEATILPNVMDFDRPAEAGDGAAYRAAAGVGDNDVVFLQPTRVIPRKGIELTLELASRLPDQAIKVIVSHANDLDHAYWDRLEQIAGELEVDLRLTPVGLEGTKLADVYAAADLVCFPSLYEGFGNALLEAFYYRRPVFANRYSVYRRDIAPTGVECIEIDGELTDEAVARVARWLAGDSDVAGVIARNYQVGAEHFSYDVVRMRLGHLLSG